jgi:hypothetical protein
MRTQISLNRGDKEALVAAFEQNRDGVATFRGQEQHLRTVKEVEAFVARYKSVIQDADLVARIDRTADALKKRISFVPSIWTPAAVQTLFPNERLRDATPVIAEPSLIGSTINGLIGSTLFTYALSVISLATFDAPSVLKGFVITKVVGIARSLWNGPDYDLSRTAGQLAQKRVEKAIEPEVNAQHPRAEYWRPFLDKVKREVLPANERIGVVATFSQGSQKIEQAFFIEPEGQSFNYGMAVPGDTVFDQLETATAGLDKSQPVSYQFRLYQRT